MRNAELSDETSTLPSHENIKNERSSQATKKTKLALTDVPLELRKKEARKPLYLIRYE